MSARLPLRLARTAAFAAVCVALAVLAHLAGGGSMPTPWAVGLALAGVSALAMALTGRERSAATISCTLVVAQVALHELFDTAKNTPLEISGHSQGLSVGTGMWVAHITATLITAWWLARGEAALWSLLRRLGARLVLLRPLPHLIPVRRAVPFFYSLAVPVSEAVEHSVSRRGPPLPA